MDGYKQTITLESIIGSLESGEFERFCLRFLTSGVNLSIERRGKQVTKVIVGANKHGYRGATDLGVDVIAVVEGEHWAFQCKQFTKWTKRDTENAIKAAQAYAANHYFLWVGCPVDVASHELIRAQDNWTIWGIEDICAYFLNKVPRSSQERVLAVDPQLFKILIPYANRCLVDYRTFFGTDSAKSPPHALPLVGRKDKLQKLIQSAGKNKVTLLVAKGGEGKSRLLYELAKSHDRTSTSTQVEFFNPHADEKTLDATLDDEIKRIVVIDDAHRSESISNELIHLVSISTRTHLVLATRPQGVESVIHILSMHNLLEKKRGMEIPNLSQKDEKALAKEALGEEHSRHAERLVELSDGSPFLIIQAGTLVAKGLLDWGQWHDEQSFRVGVFQCYENEYLKYLEGNAEDIYKQYLRLLSLLSPVELKNEFCQRSGDCFGLKAYEMQQLTKRLQNAGLLSEGTRNVRVIPDLYSDFLTYEVAYDPPKSLPTLIACVHRQFPEMVGAMLRNLSEATWIAASKGTDCSEVIAPLFNRILEDFENSPFRARVDILKHWASFSVFLPAETLTLAVLAMRLKEAPMPSVEESSWLWTESDFQSVCAEIPAMLKPVANYHLAPKKRALDILWELGKTVPLGSFGNDSGHPWTAISEAIKYEPTKPVDHVEEALDWVSSWVRLRDVHDEIKVRKNVLSILLHPCFERFVEFREWHGRTFRWWKQPVDIERTRIVRDRALDVLRWVIENLDWQAALETVDLLTHAMHRCAPAETKHFKKADHHMACWRPERFKALEVIESLLQKHPHIMVKHSVRKTLLRDLAYEDDSVFRQDVRNVLSKLDEDFELRLTTVVNSPGGWEFDDDSSEEMSRDGWFEKHRQRWVRRVEQVSIDLIEKYPDPAKAARFLLKSARIASEAGFTSRHADLFESTVARDADYARRLARHFIDQKDAESILPDWFFLLVGISRMDSDPISDLLNGALHNSLEPIQKGIINYFDCRDRGQIELTLQDRTIVEAVLKSTGEETISSFVNLVGWLGDRSAPWGMRLLAELPHDKGVVERFDRILEAVFPYRTRETLPEEEVVKKLLSIAVETREIAISNNSAQWSRMSMHFPEVVYRFFVKRIEYQQSHPEVQTYRAIPYMGWEAVDFKNLPKTGNYKAILETLWEKSASTADDPALYEWRKLFHEIVIPETDFWRTRLLDLISKASSMDELHDLCDLISFKGSLIVFRMIDVTKSFLEKSLSIDGEEGLKSMMAWLYAGSGPQIRSYTNAQLSAEHDYLEEEARKAAGLHKDDDLLQRFFQQVMDFEQDGREQNRCRYFAEMDEE